MKKYVVLEKEVGQTPLVCAEEWRAEHPAYAGVPLAYAGRLDPMASGKLLVLIGDECKNQTDYHGLDKEYEFSVLFGIESDSQDVLGRLTTNKNLPFEWKVLEDDVESVTKVFVGEVELPYPKFSSKTVQGKPLHTWTLEGRLDEIEIPTNKSTVYRLDLDKIETINKKDMVNQALAKVNSIPEVTDPRKIIGNDFRRKDVRADWDDILNDSSLPSEYSIAHFTCIASSGTYMRTLASEIAKKLGTYGLAWSIHRTEIGSYDAAEKTWKKRF